MSRLFKTENALRFLTIPGGGGSPANHWQSCWEKECSTMARVDQGDWDRPDKSEWVATLDSFIRQSEKPTILVAHSVGCITAMHWTAALASQVIGVFLVAPADVEDEWADPPAPYASFRSIPLQALRIPSLIVASTNDPYLSLSRAKFLAEAWGSELKVLGEYGHIGSESHLGRWHEGIDLLDSFSVHCMEVKDRNAVI
ncbi:RBBP9/YdeN family alpha/beta hydrolase [Marinomonas profundimaris]|uniref:Alpha/beta hydrolase n=1 Tax=Marinomonas profundimaris TaxID=1208321 RepID=W1RQ84_9GAMM|nr:alpha/beta hydrolase [Marinomonas profundimaris]ETI59201.1 alpha/beta hydrolase [Marinomonas profundimaris]